MAGRRVHTSERRRNAGVSRRRRRGRENRNRRPCLLQGDHKDPNALVHAPGGAGTAEQSASDPANPFVLLYTAPTKATAQKNMYLIPLDFLNLPAGVSRDKHPLNQTAPVRCRKERDALRHRSLLRPGRARGAPSTPAAWVPLDPRTAWARPSARSAGQERWARPPLERRGRGAPCQQSAQETTKELKQRGKAAPSHQASASPVPSTSRLKVTAAPPLQQSPALSDLPSADANAVNALCREEGTVGRSTFPLLS